MPVKSLILMRHAEREDRAAEKAGIDWISTAPRPQDPQLSTLGRAQAANVGEQLRSAGITKILCSPMIRTVESADIVAEKLGMGANSICVEMGLVEEAKSFRGKALPEPRPNWNPLILPTSEVAAYSNGRIVMDYVSLMEVRHEYDESQPNTVREVHPTLTQRDDVTRDRVREIFERIINAEALDGETVLCVAHGATVKAACKIIEKDLPEELKLKGDHAVSCYSQFVPADPATPLGAWRSLTGGWCFANVGEEEVADTLEDKGFAAGPSFRYPQDNTNA